MRISDWSSDVCSSDLGRLRRRHHTQPLLQAGAVGSQADPLSEAVPLQGRKARPVRRRRHALALRPRSDRVGQARQEPVGRRKGLASKTLDRTLAGARKFNWPTAYVNALLRSEEHTSELQSLMRISYA